MRLDKPLSDRLCHELFTELKFLNDSAERSENHARETVKELDRLREQAEQARTQAAEIRELLKASESAGGAKWVE